MTHAPTSSANSKRGLSAILFVLVAAIFFVITANANAAFVYTFDEGGAELAMPDQKDLTMHGIDYANSPVIDVVWNWDEIEWPGSNTGDACALFDGDADAKVNYAVCVTVSGDPAALDATYGYRVFSCNDTKVANCMDDTLIPGATTTCAVTNPSATDPFPANPTYDADTRASCAVNLLDFGGANVQLINTCAYTSHSPSSSYSDCVLVPREGFLVIDKIATPDDSSAAFDFQLDGTGPSVFTANGSATSGIIAVKTNTTHSLTETAPEFWELTGATCSDGSGTLSGETLSGINIAADETVTCTFNNSKQLGSLTVVKHVINNSGGSSAAGDFSLSVEQGGADVSGSPAAGSETGTPYTLTPGTYNVSEAPVAGYNATYSGDCDSNGGVTLADDDDLTCTITNDDVPDSSIDIEKSVQAGDEIVQINETVNYVLAVTNGAGSDTISDVDVSDPNCSATPTLQSGDDGDNLLEEGETWIFTCTQSYATPGVKPNIATASGNDSDDNGVTDTDDADVTVESSSIQIVKTVDDDHIQSGQLVTYTLVVTNTGSDPLSGVDVADTNDKCGAISGPVKDPGDLDDLLETGEVWTYTCTANPTADVNNVATASGTSTSGDPVSDTDDADVTVEVSVIDVEKTASDPLAYDGMEVTYEFRVTNPGLDPLSGVTLNDPHCPAIEAVDTDGDGDTNNPPASVDNDGDENDNDLLDPGAPGETWVFTCKRVVHTSDENVQTGLFTNEVTVTGTSESGDEVTAKDTADVDVIHPAMELSKVADQATVAPGATVKYTITAKNTGDTRLFDLSVADPLCGSKPEYQGGDTGNDGNFDPGEEWVHTCTSVINQTTTNVATSSANDPKEGPVDAADEATVTVEIPPPVVPQAIPSVDIPVFEQCVSRSLKIKPTYSNGSPARGVLYIDGKKVKTIKKNNPTFKVDVRKYKAGEHKIRAVFTYSDGTRVVARGEFDKCRAKVTQRRKSPTFTG